MNTYITSTLRDGLEFDGPRISAASWDEAEKLAADMHVTLLGQLAFEWIAY